jgi:hypothetical protein
MAWRIRSVFFIRLHLNLAAWRTVQHFQFLIDSRKCHGCNKPISEEREKRPLVDGSVRKQKQVSKQVREWHTGGVRVAA